jgi:hypothetical protein
MKPRTLCTICAEERYGTSSGPECRGRHVAPGPATHPVDQAHSKLEPPD